MAFDGVGAATSTGYDPELFSAWGKKMVDCINGGADSVSTTINKFITTFNEAINAGYFAGGNVTKNAEDLKAMYTNISKYYKELQEAYIEELSTAKENYRKFQEAIGDGTATLFEVPSVVALTAMDEIKPVTDKVNINKTEIDNTVTKLQTCISEFEDTSVSNLIDTINQVGSGSNVWYGPKAEAFQSSMVDNVTKNAASIKEQLTEVVNFLSEAAATALQYL